MTQWLLERGLLACLLPIALFAASGAAIHYALLRRRTRLRTPDASAALSAPDDLRGVAADAGFSGYRDGRAQWTLEPIEAAESAASAPGAACALAFAGRPPRPAIAARRLVWGALAGLALYAVIAGVAGQVASQRVAFEPTCGYVAPTPDLPLAVAHASIFQRVSNAEMFEMRQRWGCGTPPRHIPAR